MAKTTSDKPSASTEETLKQQKKQARREAKLMLEIEEANKDLKKSQKKQSKAQARLEERSAYVHTLETRLEELRAPSMEPAIEMPQDSAELERQKEPSELDSGVALSDGNQQASPETVTSTSTYKAPAQKTVARRKPTATKRPTSSPSATKRPANRSQGTRHSQADAE
jgi:predicted nuclease with TOPRIM domain